MLYFQKASALRISNMIFRGCVATKSESQQHQRISSISSISSIRKISKINRIGRIGKISKNSRVSRIRKMDRIKKSTKRDRKFFLTLIFSIFVYNFETFSKKELYQAYRLLYSGLKSRSLHYLRRAHNLIYPSPSRSSNMYRRSYLKGCLSIYMDVGSQGFRWITANTDMLTMLTSQHLNNHVIG